MNVRAVPVARASARRARPRAGRLLTTIGLYLVLGGVAAATLLPLVYGLLSSVKPLPEILSSTGTLLPRHWQWSNYPTAWTRGQFSLYFLNSVVVTLGVVVLDTLAASMCGYVLARMRLPGQRLLEAVFMATLFIGVTTAMLYPQYEIARRLGMANLSGMVFVELAGVLIIHTYLVKAFVSGLSPEIEEAARLDGCGFFGLWWRVAFPLMRPILATTVIMAFEVSWNNYQVPLAFSLAAPELRTLVVGVAALQYDAVEGISSYDVILAGANLALIPIVVVFLALQRYFVRGWTEGALKG